MGHLNTDELGGAGPGGYNYDNEVHVDKSGNDADAGTSTAPVLTIGQAITLAAARDVIVVHPGIYVEDVTLPTFVHLVGPGAVILGTLTLDDDCFVFANTVRSGGGDCVVFDSSGGSGFAQAVVSQVSAVGVAGANGLTSLIAGTQLVANVGIIYGGTGVAVGDMAGGLGDIEAVVGKIDIGAAAGIGVACNRTGRRHVRVGRIVESGPGVGTSTAIHGDGDTIAVVAEYINCNELYDAAAIATIDLRCPDITGTRTGAAGATVNLTDQRIIDSGAVAGDPNVLVVNGDRGQVYYDRINNNYYRNTAAFYGATWRLS